jgi:O-antigen ligase
MLNNITIDKIYQYLLIMLAFLIPLTVSGANIIILIIVVLWLFSGNYKSKYNHLKSSKLMIASIVFYCIHIIAIFWTEDLIWGLHILHKMWYFLLLFPVLFNIVQRKDIKYYVYAFLLAILLTEVVSYLIWLEIIPEFKNASVANPTPFMSHVSYNPILAFAIYLVLHEVLFNKNLNSTKFFWLGFFALTMSINMFITYGRAGQIMFFAMLAILTFQFFESQRLKALIVITIVIPGIFFAAYYSSPPFQDRVNLAIQEAVMYEADNIYMNNGSSVGQRINYAINSWDIIKQNLLVGVGTGDFPREYRKINQINSSHLPNITNPHNMYVLVLVQLGLIGLVSMLSIFYYQIKLSFLSSNKFIRDSAITLPLLFLVIMLSDSYLLGHYTTLMYVFFSSFLYKDFEKT